MLCFVVLVALAAMATATQPMVISNGVVKVTVAADGLVSMLELVSPSAGVKPLALTLDHDGWEATVRPGGAPGTMRRFLVTTKPSNDTQLSSASCAPNPSRASQPDKLSAILAWNCEPTGVIQSQGQVPYTVEAVYSLQPGGSFVTKTLRIGSGAPDTSEFFVTSVTPWTGLSVAAVGATQPATWLDYKNGFKTDLEIAGFARWDELARGIFVTVQNPFGKYSDGPAVSPYAPPPPPAPVPVPTGGIIIGATYASGVAQSHKSIDNAAYHEAEGATLGLTALTAYYNDGTGVDGAGTVSLDGPPPGPHGKPSAPPTGLNTGEYIAFTQCVEAFLLDSASRANRTVKVNVAWDENDYQVRVTNSILCFRANCTAL